MSSAAFRNKMNHYGINGYYENGIQVNRIKSEKEVNTEQEICIKKYARAARFWLTISI